MQGGGEGVWNTFAAGLEQCTTEAGREREHCLEMRTPQGTGVEKSDLVPHPGQP